MHDLLGHHYCGAARPVVAGALQVRRPRKLFDRVVLAFHHACDDDDLVVAERLLTLLEFMATERPIQDEGSRRRTLKGLIAAHERLWYLRHPVIAS